MRVAQPSRETTAPWVVVHGGQELAVPSLDTVKRLIIEGKVGADDTLSRGGGAARRLGDIEQFQPFLRVGEFSGSYQVLPGPGSEDERGGERDGERDGEPGRHASEVEVATAPAARRGLEEAEAAEESREEEPEAGAEVGAGADLGDTEAGEASDADGEDVGEDDGLEGASPEERGEAEVAEGEFDDEPDEKDTTEPRPLGDSGAHDALEHDDLPISLDKGTGRKVALALLGLMVFAAAVLATLYFAAPDTFYTLLPFLK